MKVDVRIVSASNRDLEAQVREGTFREDLYYRLNVFSLRMPALRERSEDLPLLLEHFYRKFRGGIDGDIVTPGALKALMNHPFPGNVRELENLVERCLVLGSIITEENLPAEVMNARQVQKAGQELVIPQAGMDLEAYLAGIEKRLILQALDASSGVKKNAAALLGLTFRSFRYRLAKFGMDEE